MKDLLDTNVVSEWSKPKPHGAASAWLDSQSPSDFGIPSIAFFEIQVGIERARRQHPIKAAELSAWLDRLHRTATVVPFDAAAARETARLIHGTSLDLLEDAMIAAIAKVNGLTVITRNTKDFEHFGVPQFNPFLFRKKS